MPRPLSADNLLGGNAAIAERLAAIGRVFSKADSIVAGKHVPVRIERDAASMPPAWSDGETITLNNDAIRVEDFDSVVRLYGLNFHELAHILYTPRRGHPLTDWASSNGYWPSMNALEDQRIETIMTRRWPSTSPWLTATVSRWILEDPAQLAGAYSILRGRRYLPGEVRGLARASYAQQSHLPVLDSVIDEYRELRFARQRSRPEAVAVIERAKELIAEYHALFHTEDAPPTLPSGPSHGTGWGEPGNNGAPVSDKEQEAPNNDDELDDESQPQGSGQTSDHDSDNDHGGSACCTCKEH